MFLSGIAQGLCNNAQYAICANPKRLGWYSETGRFIGLNMKLFCWLWYPTKASKMRQNVGFVFVSCCDSLGYVEHTFERILNICTTPV